jgi:serine/threonine-protein kinase RsbW
MERVQVKIPSKIENLRKVEKLVDSISAECNLNQEVYGNVLIATLEAANNAILHGNKLDESKSVDIDWFTEKDQLHVLVKDYGKGFDYASIPDPTAPENIENINGRGIFLMDKLSDELVFYDDGTRVELIFNIK